MAPKRKRTTRISEASEPAAVEENGDSPKMTLRPRKVRVLSPPAHNTRSKHLSQDLDGLEETLNTPPNKREVAALRADTSPKAVRKVVEEAEGEEQGEQPAELNQNKAEEAQEEDSDSDAAPEAVSLTKSQADARKKTANQAKAAKDQDTKAKQRRRDRDAKLKSQAEEREKRRKEREEDDEKRKKLGLAALPETHTNGINGHVEDAEDSEAEEVEFELQNEIEDEFDPTTAAFLPQSILDALPTSRSPTPPLKPQPTTTMLSKNLTLLTKHTHRGVTKLPLPQPPKDVVVAPRTTVSVLQDKNKSKYLPPMIEVKGKVVKENWLLGRNTLAGLGGKNLQKGRQGKMGSSKVVRRPWGKTSFT
jgi:hypothetical protein